MNPGRRGGVQWLMLCRVSVTQITTLIANIWITFQKYYISALAKAITQG